MLALKKIPFASRELTNFQKFWGKHTSIQRHGNKEATLFYILQCETVFLPHVKFVQTCTLCTCPERWHQKEKPQTHMSSSSSVTCSLTSIKQVKVNLLRIALYSLNHSEPEHFGQNVYLLLASFSKCLIQDTMASYCLHSAWV